MGTKKQKWPSTRFLIVQVPGRCLQKSAFPPSCCSKFSKISKFSRALSASKSCPRQGNRLSKGTHPRSQSPAALSKTICLLEVTLSSLSIRRRRPTPATLSTLSMSPRQRKKTTRTTPTMKELQTMVEHHLGQQKQGDEPEGAAESSGTQETRPPGITDTGAEPRLGTSVTAQKPAEPIPKTQERCSEKPSTHIPPLDSQGANSVRAQGWATRPTGEQAMYIRARG
uniref:Protein phosphatase 1 regulatory subunit 1A n=1 Tax=Spermophilus dauricus TaxID=99837 RepID=A0A8C9QC46_SPEDA